MKLLLHYLRMIDFTVAQRPDAYIANSEYTTKMFHFMIQPSYIRRIIGRNISVVENSFSCKIKDGSMVFKPFLITRRRVHRSVRKALRDECKKYIEEYVQEKERKDVFQEIINEILQKTMSKKLKKIYPLAVCEIRVAKVDEKL